ncbi:hypothetical protein [Nonlabens marinus]|uniref:Uncharacterized protein n=1 Tax=Nonlabens marinus S1-08 TaxID=1454201 RepID=W8W096_9FLAO|nr:hypothetical protein [Nonlabens marinus]BAO55941.1 hypothetical protein NMS_1932 [Nonlabens marinus S1-08]
MSKTYFYSSIVALLLTLTWLGYELSLRHFVKWHFLVAGGIHFLLAIIINRQFTKKDINYLGWIHVVLAVVFFGYGHFS